jgi:hypothetical protein
MVNNLNKENHPDLYFESYKTGFNVEIDVWFVDGKFKLGHDEPQYDFHLNYLKTILVNFGYIVKI